MPNSTVTLQTIIDFARTIPDIMPVISVGGFSQSPALRIANQVATTMMSPSMNWKWNRILPGVFYTNSVQQDYATNTIGLGWLESGFVIDINSTSSPKPLWPIEAGRDIVRTSWQWGRIGTVAWLPNNQLVYGAWAANSTYTKIIGTSSNPGTPLTQIQDPNGNFWYVSNNVNATVTTGGTQPTWPTNPVYPTVTNPSQAPTTQPDGSVVWTALNPNAAGFRVYPLPPTGGNYYEVHTIGQKNPPAFTSFSQTLDPIPDELSAYFQQGFIAYCYQHSRDKNVRGAFAQEFQLWMKALHDAASNAAREKEEAGFFPTEGIQQGGYAVYMGPANPYYPGGY